MKKLSFTLGILALVGCGSKNDPAPYEATFIDVHSDFYVLDHEGNDLLDPDNPDAIGSDDLDIYYVIDGEAERFYESNLDAPKGFSIYEPEGDYEKYRIRLFLNTSETKEVTRTLLKWSDFETDTIKTKYYRSENSLC